ncbi:hypothetical protein BN2475_220036 [Paraburkholderia ribeironis]|uniref:Uncharacterized protein n=1 Tax=Paraburkholderia ribeironis TaxID=1247936 RepID=A0A1N7RX57_9BURK|nr:hypothetical protein BN2475_220036 [Paraburkholderia ribeironis]
MKPRHSLPCVPKLMRSTTSAAAPRTARNSRIGVSNNHGRAFAPAVAARWSDAPQATPGVGPEPGTNAAADVAADVAADAAADAASDATSAAASADASDADEPRREKRASIIVMPRRFRCSA